MPKQIISTNKAPKAVGPYNQAVKAGHFIFISGQIPFNEKGELVSEDPVLQAEQCLKNIGAVLEAAGCTFEEVVKVNVFVTDINAFGEINEIYKTFFKYNFPARALVEVSNLPKNVKVEIEAVAYKE